MGKTRKRYNWKARLNGNDSGENSNAVSEETIELDFNVKGEKYDSSNPLVLQSRKKKKQEDGSEENANSQKSKPLSRKQKHRLKKTLEKKKKTLNRSQLYEKLQEVQATSDELQLLTSTSSMQTFGLKKLNSGASSSEKSLPHHINTVKGSKRKVNQILNGNKKVKYDPKIAGLEDDLDDISTDESDLSDKEEPAETVVPCSDKSCIMNSVEDLDEKLSVTDVNSNTTLSVTAELTSGDKNIPDDACEKKTLPSEASNKLPCEPAVFVPVLRSPEIQAIRETLPIYSEEQAIMEAVRENAVVVIHGTTGSGKTTQVPQFLYEAGYTRNNMMIGITEPRRIAAVQMASRVANEMNLPDAVSYHIRYEKTARDDKTQIKFMTDGVLLREIRSNFILSRYSVIIIDEAHERSMYSDILIGLLSRIILLREKKGNPLKVIIMSATLCIDDFTENQSLFKTKPFLITLDSRQYDVIHHFETLTPTDYVQAAFDKVCKIHRQLPSGGILVFVTGEKEVNRLCRLLRKAFPFNGKRAAVVRDEILDDEFPEFSNKKFKKLKKTKKDELLVNVPKINLDDYSIEPLDNEAIQHQHSDGENDLEDDKLLKNVIFKNSDPLYVLPLYAVLPAEEQAKIFESPPTGCRLCVVATNVAETSVTIPGLKYVVDSGKVKTRVYDKSYCGISSFKITWISKASAQQRAGRAGRTEGGHCYRLYSSAVYEHEFPEFMLPEIQRMPVDEMLLQMKAMGIDRVVNFPFPSAPDKESLKAAEKHLVALGAVQDLQQYQNYKDISKWEYSAKVTSLGQLMSKFPLSPRYAKMLVLAHKHEVIPHIVAIVSAMTVPEVFLNSEVPNNTNHEAVDSEPKYDKVGIKKIGAGKGNSLKLGDAMVLLRAVAVYEEAQNKTEFCEKYCIRRKAMQEIQKMHLQLTREMNRSFDDLDLSSDLTLNPPTDDEMTKLRKIISACLTDHVAKRVPLEIQKEGSKYKNAYKCLDLEEFVFIHPSSILTKSLPEFVVYQEIFQTSKYFMRTVIEIEPEWLPAFAHSQCAFSPALENPPPYYDNEKGKIMSHVTSTFGRWHWDLPIVIIEMKSCLKKYNYFCFYLLNGEICAFFLPYKKLLLSAPSVMLKEWAKLVPITRHLLQAVMDKGIDSKEALFVTWKSNPKYLLKEYCEWLPEQKHMEIACQWPPLK